MHINLQHAEQAIEAARKKAIALKTQMCIAIVDSGANLKAFMGMDLFLWHGHRSARQAVPARQTAFWHRALE